MTTHTSTNETLVSISSVDFASGYEKGRIWYFHGEAEGEPDEEYLITNLISLHERGAFQELDNLRWHVGFLLGMVSRKFIQEQ